MKTAIKVPGTISQEMPAMHYRLGLSIPELTKQLECSRTQKLSPFQRHSGNYNCSFSTHFVETVSVGPAQVADLHCKRIPACVPSGYCSKLREFM